MSASSSTASARSPAPAKGWTIGLWVVQVLLALFYGFAGYSKLFQSAEALIQMGMAYVADVPFGLVRFIGTMEVLGVIGIILPAATRILPQLTPLAALGFAAIQLLAIPLHISRGEFSVLPFNLVLLVLALFVVWGRSRKAPIAPRS